MTPRERFHAVMRFEPFDRLPIVEWAVWWNETLERWRGEGLPAELDRYGLYRHFGMDVWYQDWWRPLHWQAPRPAHHGAGIIADADDYARLRPHLFRIEDEWPLNLSIWEKWASEQARGEAVLWFTADAFFWFPRTLLGIERHLYAFHDQKDLLHRINSELAEWMITLIDRVCAVCAPDFMTFAEDMSYNNGPMLSRRAFDEFLLPYYTMVVPHLHEKGIYAFIDSDGDITRAADWFAEAGLDGILPLERQAGVDVAKLREIHPRMRFIGCYDKMVMNRGEAAMRGEFERLLPVARQGGLIVSCDHQTPPGVSLEEYRLYLRLFAEYAAKAGGQ